MSELFLESNWYTDELLELKFPLTMFWLRATTRSSPLKIVFESMSVSVYSINENETILLKLGPRNDDFLSSIVVFAFYS